MWGNIGRIVAQMCMGLGFHIAAYDPSCREEKLAESRLPCLQDGERSLRTSDIISVHVPYNEQTKDLISKRVCHDEAGAIVVNCARGGIVNENDLAEALSNDVIGGAGLDVFVGEAAILKARLKKRRT